MFEAALAGDGEEIVEHRAANAQATDMLSRMHRLQLSVLIIEPLERADRYQLPAAADTEESDGGIKQAIHLERVRILWRAVQTPELQMMLDELSHVIEPLISDRDVELIHQHYARLTLGLTGESSSSAGRQSPFGHRSSKIGLRTRLSTVASRDIDLLGNVSDLRQSATLLDARLRVTTFEDSAKRCGGAFPLTIKLQAFELDHPIWTFPI